MKIECSTCGRKYDPLKKQGICPFCGMHTTDEQLAEAVENDRIQGGTVTEVFRGYLNEKLRKEKKLSPLRKKGVQLTLCLFLVGCMALVGVWGYGRYKDKLEYYREQRKTDELPVTECRPGDQIILNGCAVRITGFRRADEFQSDMSEGFRLIEVRYTDEGKEFERLSDAYIVTEKGCSARSLDRYDIIKLTGMADDQYMDSDYADGIISAKGKPGQEHKLLFAVPDAEKEHRMLIFSTSDIYAADKTAEMKYEFLLREEDAK